MFKKIFLILAIALISINADEIIEPSMLMDNSIKSDMQEIAEIKEKAIVKKVVPQNINQSTRFENLITSTPKFVYITETASIPLTADKDTLNNDNLSRPLYIGENIEITYIISQYQGGKIIDSFFYKPYEEITEEESLLPKKIEKKEDNAIEIIKVPESFHPLPDGNLEAKYIIRINKENIVIPPLVIVSRNDEGKIDSAIGKEIILNASTISIAKDFSGVLADNLIIDGVFTKSYDDESNIVIIELTAINDNLNSFNLKFAKKQGIEKMETSIVEGKTNTKLTYYCLLPKQVLNFSFTYYNLINKHFEKKNIDIAVINDRVSTQEDISPKDNFFVLKNIAFMLIAFVIILGLWYYKSKSKNKRWYYVAILVPLAVFLYCGYNLLFLSKEITLQKGARVSILPTYNSTTIFLVNDQLEVKTIGETRDYYKIIFDKNKIGWISKNYVKR